MINFDKSEIKESLTIENIFEVLLDLGGDPEYTDFGIISSTICHNMPGEGSRKLYYYQNSGLFKCFTGCDETFDVFELIIKTAKIQNGQDFDLNDAVRNIAFKFGIAGSYQVEENEKIEDWKFLNNYDRIQQIEIKDMSFQLKPYESDILDRFNYRVKIKPWLQEGISQEAMDHARIGFYPGGDQITIPHFDVNGVFIGLRGRALCAEEAERYGKYRPMYINKQQYNHPLGMNLYNLNNSKENIKKIGKAIIFESEKSCLLYQSYFGIENDISVACCGSNISAYQIQLLLDLDVKEIIIAFDRQFQEPGDDEFKHLVKNLKKIHSKYKNFVNVSFTLPLL